MGFFAKPVEWQALAHALRLTPYLRTEAYAQGASFRKLQRSLRAPAQGSPSFEHWLAGSRDGVDVLVLQYEIGSGSSSTTCTGAVARIDPPLFLGLRISESGFFDRLFGGADVDVGAPVQDKQLRIEAFEPSSAVALLTASDPACQQVLSYMADVASSEQLYVGDSLALVGSTGIHTDPAEVGAMLDGALYLARWFRARRAVVPPVPSTLAVQREWQRFANEHAFRFDPARLKLSSTRDGMSLDIALETDGGEARTCLSARFARPLRVELQVLRTQAPGWIQAHFMGDITVGDAEFDKGYLVTGGSAAAVRAALAKPRLLAVLKEWGKRSLSVQMSQHGIYLRWLGAVNAPDLKWLADGAALIHDDLFGVPHP